MTNFTYYNPVEIRFGIGASQHIGETAAAYGINRQKEILWQLYAPEFTRNIANVKVLP